MSTIRVEINDTPLKQWISKASSIQKSVIMSNASDIMHRNVMNNFVTQRDSFGKPWQRLSSNYKPASGTLLQRAGYLRNSIWKRSSVDNAEVGTNLVYAAIHNYGGTIPERMVKPKKKGGTLAWQQNGKTYFSKGHMIPETKMPQREFMYIDDNAVAQIQRMILSEIPN